MSRFNDSSSMQRLAQSDAVAVPPHAASVLSKRTRAIGWWMQAILEAGLRR